MKGFLRIASVALLAIAVVSEYVHCASADTPEHPRPTGWRKAQNMLFTFECGVALVILVRT